MSRTDKKTQDLLDRGGILAGTALWSSCQTIADLPADGSPTRPTVIFRGAQTKEIAWPMIVFSNDLIEPCFMRDDGKCKNSWSCQRSLVAI